MVVDGVTGVLIGSPDPQLLAQALLALISNPEKASAMGQAAFARTSRDFTWPVVGRRVTEALDLRITTTHAFLRKGDR